MQRADGVGHNKKMHTLLRCAQLDFCGNKRYNYGKSVGEIQDNFSHSRLMLCPAFKGSLTSDII